VLSSIYGFWLPPVYFQTLLLNPTTSIYRQCLKIPIRSRNSQNCRQYCNGKKPHRIVNHRNPRTQLRCEDELGCFGKLSSSCYTSCNRHVSVTQQHGYYNVNCLNETRNNSPRIDLSPHSDIFSWFWANQSFSLILRAYLEPIIYHARGSLKHTLLSYLFLQKNIIDNFTHCCFFYSTNKNHHRPGYML